MSELRINELAQLFDSHSDVIIFCSNENRKSLLDELNESLRDAVTFKYDLNSEDYKGSIAHKLGAKSVMTYGRTITFIDVLKFNELIKTL